MADPEGPTIYHKPLAGTKGRSARCHVALTPRNPQCQRSPSKLSVQEDAGRRKARWRGNPHNTTNHTESLDLPWHE